MKELEQHLLFEFIYHNPNKVCINEERSAVPGIDVILEKFLDMIEPQIREAIRNKSKTFVWYNDINALGLNNIFLKSLDMQVDLDYGDEDYSGGFDPQGVLKYYGPETKIDFRCVLNIKAKYDGDFRRNIFLVLGHEITHAYNIWQWMLKNKRDFNFTEFDLKTRYTHFKSYAWDEDNTIVLKKMHYRLSRIEMNAYIAQLKQELQLLAVMINDSKSAFNAIQRTRSYQQNFLWIEKNIAVLNSMDDLETQSYIISDTNRIADKNFTNYNQVLKYYNERWFYYKKEYLTKASKIAYDIYAENHQMFDGNEI